MVMKYRWMCGSANPQEGKKARSSVGASLLAKNLRALLGIWLCALSFTTFVGTPPGASSLLQLFEATSGSCGCEPHLSRPLIVRIGLNPQPNADVPRHL